METSPLTELDERLSTVKRWSIVYTARKQSVAEHCFNVQRICIRMALWFDIKNALELFRLSQAALHHDDDEAITGDIPSTAKAHVTLGNDVETGAALWYNSSGDRIKSIVKLADLMEAYCFLARELQVGNWWLIEHKIEAKTAVEEYIAKHPDWNPAIMHEVDKWMVKVESELSQRYTRKANGSIEQTEQMRSTNSEQHRNNGSDK